MGEKAENRIIFPSWMEVHAPCSTDARSSYIMHVAVFSRARGSCIKAFRKTDPYNEHKATVKKHLLTRVATVQHQTGHRQNGFQSAGEGDRRRPSQAGTAGPLTWPPAPSVGPKEGRKEKDHQMI